MGPNLGKALCPLPGGTLAPQPGPRFQQIGDGDGGASPSPRRPNRGRTPRPRPRTTRGRGRGRGPGCPCPGTTECCSAPQTVLLLAGNERYIKGRWTWNLHLPGGRGSCLFNFKFIQVQFSAEVRDHQSHTGSFGCLRGHGIVQLESSYARRFRSTQRSQLPTSRRCQCTTMCRKRLTF